MMLSVSLLCMRRRPNMQIIGHIWPMWIHWKNILMPRWERTQGKKFNLVTAHAINTRTTNTATEISESKGKKAIKGEQPLCIYFFRGTSCFYVCEAPFFMFLSLERISVNIMSKVSLKKSTSFSLKDSCSELKLN